MSDNYVLKSENLYCEFSKETGALVQLTSLKTGWEIHNRPELGLSFRLMVPLSEELRNNDVLGERQKLTTVVESPDSLTFRWNGVVSERGGWHPIDIEIRVAVEGTQIVYYTHVNNHSQYTVEAVYSPYIADVRPPKDVEWLKSFTWAYATSAECNLWPIFDNQHGYYGTDYPTQMSSRVPTNPFYLMRSENQGLYVGVKAHSSEPIAWHIELRPGWDSSVNSRRPNMDMIAEKPVHTPFAAIHMPYILPGEVRNLTPVALDAFTGDWQHGVDIYKNWRDTWFTMAEVPEWAKNPHAWQQLHINSPEDELRMRFTELPAIAEECKKHGVEALQLVGWNDGGQDQGNPSHDHDPRLGTWEELRDAIAKCHEIGVRVILFAKFTWADRATDWFRKDLIKLAATDPYGDYYTYPGYNYFTPAQLLYINTKRLIPMCFRSEEYMKICEDEFQKLVDLKPAGILYDESQHHGVAWLCFSSNHGHRYGAPNYANDTEFMRRLGNMPGVPKDFLLAGEACYDWEMGSYHLAYFRTENKRHIPLNRYLHPHGEFMTAITGFNDRNMVNQCLMHRYIISYEPGNFKGKLGDYPETLEYGKKMDALRTEYRKWFWDGEYRDKCEAAVYVNGEAHPTYAVFKAEDGSLGVVIANYEDEPITVELRADNGQVFNKYRSVDTTGIKDYTGSINIDGHSVVIVM